MVKVLLVNPSLEDVYEGTKIEEAVPHYPPLNLLTIAGSLIRDGHEADLIDFDLLGAKNQNEILRKKLEEVKPQMVGLSFGSPTYNQCKNMAKVVKEFDKNILVIAGGSHPSADPKGVLKNPEIDITICGEGDFSILEICNSKDYSKILGIGFKKNKKEIFTPTRPFLKDLDELPMPAFELVDIHKYKMPAAFSRKRPTVMIETSRGCAWGCTYCTKAVFGRNFRYKSPKRVVEEFKYMKKLGYKEIHIIDDMFTTSKERVKEICRLLKEENVGLSWACSNGIRVDKLDEELAQLMYDTGCYRASFGVESGNQEILDGIEKQQTLEQVRNAFRICNKVGMETTAYLILGLPGDTEETMRQTIDFAKEIKPSIVKFDILVPLPSTPLYEKWKGKYFKEEDWDNFNFHNAKNLYKHPNLSWETLEKYYNRAYFEFYFRPSYMVNRFFDSLKKGKLLIDLKLLLKTKWN